MGSLYGCCKVGTELIRTVCIKFDFKKMKPEKSRRYTELVK